MTRMEGGIGGDVQPCGHSNRIYSLCFVPDSGAGVLVSGGWDQTVQVWDAREGQAVRSISGPLVCGDSLDVRGSQLLAGSWRHEHHLQLFDLGSGRLITNLPLAAEGDQCKVYAAKFTPAGNIVAGTVGSGRPFVRCLKQTGEAMGSAFLPAGVTSIDLQRSAPGGSTLCAACGGPGAALIDLGVL